MPTPRDTIVELERKFWQSIVEHDTDTAVEMLTEPALMVNSHGAMQFDHEGFRDGRKGPLVLSDYELSEMRVMFPNESTAVVTYHAKQTMTPRGKNGGTVQGKVNDTSTWIKDRDGWKCVMHTETPAGKGRMTS